MPAPGRRRQDVQPHVSHSTPSLNNEVTSRRVLFGGDVIGLHKRSRETFCLETYYPQAFHFTWSIITLCFLPMLGSAQKPNGGAQRRLLSGVDLRLGRFTLLLLQTSSSKPLTRRAGPGAPHRAAWLSCPRAQAQPRRSACRSKAALRRRRGREEQRWWSAKSTDS